MWLNISLNIQVNTQYAPLILFPELFMCCQNNRKINRCCQVFLSWKSIQMLALKMNAILCVEQAKEIVERCFCVFHRTYEYVCSHQSKNMHSNQIYLRTYLLLKVGKHKIWNFIETRRQSYGQTHSCFLSVSGCCCWFPRTLQSLLGATSSHLSDEVEL